MSGTCTCARWRRWSITQRVATFLYVSGITSSGSSTRWGGEGHDACVTMPGLDRHPRVYVLGVPRWTWRCWSRGHRRGVYVGWGYCGKCVPWPCCGSVLGEHAPGCPEDAAS